jgi:hypothetical protein
MVLDDPEAKEALDFLEDVFDEKPKKGNSKHNVGLTF